MNQTITPPRSGYRSLMHKLFASFRFTFLLALLAIATTAGAQVQINATNFLDANFRNFVSDATIDKDKDGYLSDAEIAAVTTMYVENKGIKNLTGIEHFTALKTLRCHENQLTSLDVSKNTKLTELDCSDNDLTELDLSNNIALNDLWCVGNRIKGDKMQTLVNNLPTVSRGTFGIINTKDNSEENVITKSQVASAKGKGWTVYDWNGGYKMEYAGSDPGIAIDATNFPDANFRSFVSGATIDKDGNSYLNDEEIAAVKGIDVNNKSIANLKGIEHFTALTKLECTSNQLTALDVSNNTMLNTLFCSKNQLTELDVSKNTALKWLVCPSNQLTELDVSKNTALTQMECTSNQLTALDVSNNTMLNTLFCGKNQLTELDVSKNTALTQLSCSSNQLTVLDVSNNTALFLLNCSKNQLTELDVSKNTALTQLACHSNQLTALDVSANINLAKLECFSNQIQANKMLALVNSLPTAENGDFYVVNTQDSNEGNVITKTQVSIAKGKHWRVMDYNGQSYVEYAGAEEYPLTLQFNGQGGTLKATPNGNVGVGTEVTLSPQPNISCYLKSLKAYKTGEPTTTVTITNKKFTMPDYGVTVEAEFAAIQLSQLTVVLPTNGTLTASPSGNVIVGTVVTLTATPAEGYKLKALKAYKTGEPSTVVDITGNKFNMPDYGVTVEAEFEEEASTETYYTVTLNAGENGKLSTSSTDGKYKSGQYVMFWATPDISYQTKALRAYKTDDANVEVTFSIIGPHYEFIMPDYDVTIAAEFETNPNYVAVTGITLSLSNITLKVGNKLKMNVMVLPSNATSPWYRSKSSDYNVCSFNEKLEEIEAIAEGTATITLTTADGGYTATCKVYVVDASTELYPLTLNASAGGTLTASPSGNVAEGTEVTLTATPASGYKLKALKAYKTGEASTTVAITGNKFTMPAYEVTVEAEFEKTSSSGGGGGGNTTYYTLSYIASAGGSIKGASVQTVKQGESGTEVEAMASDGHRFVKWSDGRTTAKRTDYNVQGNLTVTAEFEKSNTTGIFDTKLDALSVYPNPTQGVLWVSVPELAEGTAAEVHVYNANGQLLQRVPARAASAGSAASRISIDLSSYPSGLYIVRVGNAMAKVVKQ